MQQSNWEKLYSRLGFQYNLILMGKKEGVVMSFPTHTIAIAFPNQSDARFEGFEIGEIEKAKEWLLKQVRRWYEDALRESLLLSPDTCEASGVEIIDGDSL